MSPASRDRRMADSRTSGVIGMVALAGTLSLGACGGSSGSGGAQDSTGITSTEKPTGAGFAERMPDWSRPACRNAELAIRVQHLTWALICPSVLPPGRGGLGFAGFGPYESVASGYVFTGYSPSLGSDSNGGHWSLAVGRRANMSVIVQRGRSVRSSIAGLPVRIYRMPRYEDGGGYYGGHIVVEWMGRRAGCQTSVHGYAHRLLAIRMMRAIIVRCAKELT